MDRIVRTIGMVLCLFIMAAEGIVPRMTRAATIPLIQEFAAPSRNAVPLQVIAGTGGDVWFNQRLTNTITRFNLKDKQFKVYHTFTSTSYVHTFTIDKEDNPWFSSSIPPGNELPVYDRSQLLGRISFKTGELTRYQPITLTPFEPILMAQGKDGNIWYSTYSALGYVRSNGTIVEFPKPQYIGYTQELVAGRDGNMWFIDPNSGIGKVTPQGHFTEYPIAVQANDSLASMVIGPDGNFWFISKLGNEVGRMTPKGHVMSYIQLKNPSIGSLSNITGGADGNFWFADIERNQLVSMNLQGTFAAYPIPLPANKLNSLTRSTDGTLWFTEKGANMIGQFTPPDQQRQGQFQEFIAPQQSIGPQIILPGPKGDLWFNEAQTSSIGRITTNGVLLSQYSTANSAPIPDLARGKDGNIWLPYRSGEQIARITPEGKITVFPTYHYYSSFSANGDGNVWFLAENYVFGYITPQGKIKEFGFPPASSAYMGSVNHLTAGPDGNLWITETLQNKIGRLTRSGTITEYTIPSAPPVDPGLFKQAVPPSSLPTLITGAAGNVWFIEANSNQLGRITSQGKITEFPMKEHLAEVRAMTFGADGNLWLADGEQLIRVTPSGVESSYQLAFGSNAEGITAGPDGNIWFSDGGAGKIGRLQLT